MDEDEDSRLIADNPGYPMAVVPTQASRTVEFSWANNKITLGSRPVQTETNQSLTLKSPDKVNKENLCKHCNVEFSNNNLLIKHLLELVSTVKKPVKRKIEKAKSPKECPKKSKISDNILKRKNYSSASEDNCKFKSQMQVEPIPCNNEHSVQQMSRENSSPASDSIPNKIKKVRFNLDSNKNTKKDQKLNYIYKCKLCNHYFGNKRQMKQHKGDVHPDIEDIFVKLPTANNLKKKNKTKDKVLKVTLKKITTDQLPTTKTLSYRPEMKESISIQNKAGPSWQLDTANQTQAVVDPLTKKVAVSKYVPGKKRVKSNSPSQGHSSVKVLNSEKTELFRSICGLHFITCKSFQKHSDVCYGSCNTPKTNCKKCGYIFPLDTLPIHQSKHHNINQINVFDIVELSQKHGMLQCISCTQKFTYKKSYQTHVLKCKFKIRVRNLCSQKVLYKCFQCNLHYTTRLGLRNHLRNNHSMRYAIKKCDECKILLSSRSFQHHVQIQHGLFECELKDLTIRYGDEKMQNKINTSDIHTTETAGQSLTNTTDNRAFDKNYINESFIDLTESNAKDNVVSEKNKEGNISITNNISKELSYKPTGILPNVLYKCNKCETHFVTKLSHKDHVSSDKCRNSNKSDFSKCPKCNLVFYTESVMEHLVIQHLDKMKTSNDFLIICNDSVNIQSHCKANGSITKVNVHPAKSFGCPNSNDKPVPVRKTSETDVLNVEVYNKGESVKLFAEAWIRNKCTKTTSFASIDPTFYNNFLYQCPKCTLNFLNCYELKCHVFECKGDSFDWTQCPICCYSFVTSSLSLHIYVHHAKMELKRENFLFKSPEPAIVSSKERTNGHLTPKKQLLLTENKTVDNFHQSKTDSLLNHFKENGDTEKEITITDTCIDSNTNSPDVFDLVSSQETKDDEATDGSGKEVTAAEKYNDTNTKSPDVINLLSSQETKDLLLSNFKSSRAKIAWAIDSIEDSYLNDSNKSPKQRNAEVNESFREKETVVDLSNNRTVIRETSTKTDHSSNEIEKDVSEEIDSILSALDVNSKKQTKLNSIRSSNQITDTEEDILTNKVFEDIDSLVASFGENSKPTKKQEENIVLYKCKLCSVHFMTSPSLQTHILKGVHNENLGTNCNICHLTFNKHTITKHITKHHKINNMTPLNYTIKTSCRARSTNKRQQVVSDFFIKKQLKENILKYAKNMSGLTKKQKLSLCKALKKPDNNKTTTTQILVSSKQTQNPILKQLLNSQDTSRKQQQYNEDITLSNSPNSTLTQASGLNLDIIDLSNSQNSEVDGEIGTNPTPPQLSCIKISQSPNKRKFSIDSNVTNYEKSISITKNRTMSEDQRHSENQKDVITNQNFDSCKIVRININTGTDDKSEKNITIVTENVNSFNEKSKSIPTPHFRLHGEDSMPINSKITEIAMKAKSHCIHTVQNTSTKSKTDKNESIAKPSLSIGNAVSLETISIMDDRTEYQTQSPFKNISQSPKKHALKNTFRKPNVSKISNPSTYMDMNMDETRSRDVFSKPNCQKSNKVVANTTKPHSPVTTDSSCIQKPGTSSRSVITFEDSIFEIEASCANNGNANTTATDKVNTEDNNKEEKIKRKNQVSPRDSKFSNSIATPPRRDSSSAHGKDPVDIIDITEETNDNYNTYSPRLDRSQNVSTSLNKAPNMAAFNGAQNRLASPNSAGVSNTSMAFPSAPNFNLFNLMDDPLFHYLTLPFHQHSGFNISPNHSKPQQNRKRATKKPSAPEVPNIFDCMQSCPICRSRGGVSVKQHLKVRNDFFLCCFCNRKSATLELSHHIQICGSQIYYNSSLPTC